MILDDITGAIGNTPLLRLTRFAPDSPATLLATAVVQKKD